MIKDGKNTSQHWFIPSDEIYRKIGIRLLIRSGEETCEIKTVQHNIFSVKPLYQLHDISRVDFIAASYLFLF